MTKKRNNPPARPPPSAPSRPSTAPSASASSSNVAPAKSASSSVSAVQGDKQRPGSPNTAGVVGKANKLLAMLKNETQRLESMDPSKPDDLASTINSLGSRLSELQSQAVEEARSAAAVAEHDPQAHATRVAPTAKVDKLKEFLASALEGQDALTTACNSFLKEVGEDKVDVDTATVSNIATLSSTVVEFVGMIRKAPKKTDGSSVKAVTRFLATNSLEVASTVISAAKAASQFVPIPGIAVAIGIIDNILANVKDGMDSIGGLKSFLADLEELKTILAPMANQWFSADVRGKCAELVDLLKEVQISIEAGTSTTGSWYKIVTGAKRAEVEAQMAGYRSRLAMNKELISLAMQEDSAVMLMHTAKQLNLIDTKTDKILQFLRPRTLHLRHDDFLISAVPEDSKGTFAVYKAKMDGMDFVLKTFEQPPNPEAIENEARQWFKLNHASLLPITGICLEGKDDRKPFIAMPYMDCDLKSYLAAHPDLSVHERLRILTRIACGLKYLHLYVPDGSVVHGSLSMSRIHLDSKGIKVKISVGMRSIRTLAGSIHSASDAKYMAPEAKARGAGQVDIDGQQELDPSVDVYSFGVLAKDVLAQAANQLQPPDNISGDVWQSLQLTLKTCCNIKPDDRPDISQIVKDLTMATRPVDGGVVKVQDGASDLEILCAIFPEWAKDSEITVNSERPTGELMNLYDDSAKRITSKWQLEWDEQHNLTALRLTGCGLFGNIPKDIGHLMMLKELWLDQNEFDGEIPQGICQLTKLTSLRLGQNNLQGSVPHFILKLTHLDELDIADNQITELPASIGKLTQLKTLNVCNNQITKLPDTMANLTNLTKLLIGGKAIGGISAIGKMISLKELRITQCGLAMLPYVISDLANLEILDLSGNELKKVPGCIFKLKNLVELDLSENQLKGSIPAELGKLANLTHLYLSNNQLSGKIPSELGKLVNLAHLDLEDNQLEGKIPSELGKLANLTELDLCENQLTGGIPAQLGKLVNLTWLGLEINSLEGTIPSELGNLFNLTGLSLCENQLTGGIPAQLGNLVNLSHLFLHQNQLTGSIPTELGKLVNLTDLNLAENQLEGNIPAELGSLVHLTYMDLSENKLSGGIPSVLGNLIKLTHLDLHKNELEGEIPSELGNLVNLTHLDLSENQLEGSIPSELGRLVKLKSLDLSDNHMEGSIPPELGNLVNLTELDLHKNKLEGEIPSELGNLVNLTHLDLSENELEGSIPSELGRLVKLKSLDLCENQLTGGIPAQLGKLVNLTWLGLHSNSLSHKIPSELSNLARLNGLDLEDNHLNYMGVNMEPFLDNIYKMVASSVLEELKKRYPQLAQRRDQLD